MTLENTLRKSLAEAPPDAGGRIAFSHEGWTVAVRPDSSDALSCSLWDLSVQRDGASAGGDVRAWAEQTAQKVTGLLEPLKVHEVDDARQVALLRSSAPTPRDPGLHYTEVELQGTRQATVRRFRGFHDTSRSREQIPFAMTHEAIAKMIGDITADK
jgi:hypothetical protein